MHLAGLGTATLTVPNDPALNELSIKTGCPAYSIEGLIISSCEAQDAMIPPARPASVQELMPRVCFASRSSLHPASAQDSYLDGAPELSIERPSGSLCPSGCQSDQSNLKSPTHAVARRRIGAHEYQQTCSSCPPTQTSPRNQDGTDEDIKPAEFMDFC